MAKKFNFLFAIICLYSCSVTKNGPINDYVKHHIQQEKKILVNQVKLPKAMTIKNLSIRSFYEVGRDMEDLYDKNTDLFNKKYLDDMFRAHENDTARGAWQNNDFTFNSQIISREELKSLIFDKNSHNDNRKVYQLSDVVYYPGKKYAFFSLRSTRISTMASYIDDCVVLMKKEKGKWVYIEKINNDPFENP